jgi:hypothetical protein
LPANGASYSRAQALRQAVIDRRRSRDNDHGAGDSIGRRAPASASTCRVLRREPSGHQPERR